MIIVFLIAFTAFFKRIYRLHHDINGKWFSYLTNWFAFNKYVKKYPLGRLDIHKVLRSTAQDGCYYPFPEEAEYSKPKKNIGEDLFIYGANTTEGTVLQVYLTRRPIAKKNGDDDVEPPRDKVSISFKLDSGDGNVYSLDEDSITQFSESEYRGSGFALEVLCGCKTSRIKFRGYLRRNQDNTLHYVQIRFLCLFYSKIFDHRQNINKYFALKELYDSTHSVDDLFEDKLEQFCQIKGTFKIEDEEDKELFFLGTIGRRFLPKSKICRRVVKLFGIDKDGNCFQIGRVTVNNSVQYRYGFMSRCGDNFDLVDNLSMTKSQFDQLKQNKSFKLEAAFKNGKKLEISVSESENDYRKCKVNGIDGTCFIVDQTFDEMESSVNLSQKQIKPSTALVVSLQEKVARSVELTGGKGASLAQLKTLSEKLENHKDTFKVPDGLVVTTSAFSVQVKSISEFDSKFKELSNVALNEDSKKKEIEKCCTTFSKWFSEQKLHSDIENKIEEKVKEQFGSEFETKLFAVRSSAAMEDSTELSAAGQMTTYLGVKGLSNLYNAVMKCWASQYEFVPIQYKHSYGQELNSPMAVVIQEMVDCDSAGVIFTCNPTNGDERILTITSNFGLGESVVSASADPDTFEVQVSIEKNAYEHDRTVSKILSKTLGKKSIMTKLNADFTSEDLESGVKNQTHTDGSEKSSLTDEEVLKLGSISLKIQQNYGNARDIEFGIKDGQIYMLQSRPITNLDSSFTQYELMHELDTPHMTEYEIYSRAHWGENLPGSGSWISCFFFMNDISFMRQNVKNKMAKETDYNPYRPPMGFVCNQLMFNMGHGPFVQMFRGYPESESAKNIVSAFFGRDITDPEVLAKIKTVSGPDMNSLKFKLFMRFFQIFMLFFAHKKLKGNKKLVFDLKKDYVNSVVNGIPMENRLDTLIIKLFSCTDVMQIHGPVSFASSAKSQILSKLLKNSKDNSHVDSDFNLLMSHCNDVVSAEVPNSLRKIALAIEDKDKFVNFSDEEAAEYLKNDKNEPGKLFASFLEEHGHRGFREIDPYYMPWGINPIPCVQVIKTLLRTNANLLPKKTTSVEEVLSKMQTPLSWWKRLIIKHFLLEWCRDAVGYRELSKSIMVKLQSYFRDSILVLGSDMAAQGILPERDLIFFLKLDEIQRLCANERNPTLIMKAKQRKRLYPKMNAMKFDEFVKGFRMAPRPAKKEIISIDPSSAVLKGVPVTIGDIKARVCVAETIDEAVNIQQGDILITYSTDIGWSPYFPLISGIVTEIGGTISHGAVIAREFGIPSLIAVDDACSVFKTGDIAYLDTKTATISKVKE